MTTQKHFILNQFWLLWPKSSRLKPTKALFWSVICLRGERQWPASVNGPPATSCNSDLFLISQWSQQVQKTCTGGRGRYMLTSPLCNHHLNYPLRQWRHHHTEGQMSPEIQGDKLQDPTHSTWRCRTDLPLIPHLRIPVQEPRRQRTLLEGGGFWALSYTLALFPFFHTSEWHIDAGQSLHLQLPTVYTKRRLIPEKTQHPPKQLMHTDTRQSTKITCLKASARPVLLWAVLLVTLVDTKKQNIPATHSPTLAGGIPTDPIDVTTPESSCSQPHWSHHKTTDEDKTLLTTPSSTLRPIFGFMCFLPHGIQLFSLALSHLFIFSSLWFLTICIPV